MSRLILAFLALATLTVLASCATRPADLDFHLSETGPGGLPVGCSLPDCALPGEYPSVIAAVLAGLDELRTHPDWNVREYGGCVFEVRSGVFRASRTARLPDDRTSREHCYIPQAPAGTQRVAGFHNHPTQEDYSLGMDIFPGMTLPLYLLAPSGVLYRYEPATRIKSRWTGADWAPVARLQALTWMTP